MSVPFSPGLSDLFQCDPFGYDVIQYDRFRYDPNFSGPFRSLPICPDLIRCNLFQSVPVRCDPIRSAAIFSEPFCPAPNPSKSLP